MNEDASKFLETAAQALKPALKHLAFNRVRDFVQEHNLKLVISEVVQHFSLWDRDTFITAHIDQDWKAHAFPIDTRMPGYSGIDQPERVELDKLILLYPKEGTVMWAFQRIIYKKTISPQHFSGSSSICLVDDGNYFDIIEPPLNFPENFWRQVNTWFNDSKSARNKSAGELAEAHTSIINAFLKK